MNQLDKLLKGITIAQDACVEIIEKNKWKDYGLTPEEFSKINLLWNKISIYGEKTSEIIEKIYDRKYEKEDTKENDYISNFIDSLNVNQVKGNNIILENFIIRKKFKFEMAHRLTSCYSTKCRANHGHSYILEVFLQSGKLDDTGMVIDFGELKKLLISYIDSWDHKMVLHNIDELIKILNIDDDNEDYKIVSYNPTAENMAKDMYETIDNLLLQNNRNNKDIKLLKVRLHETDTGYAEYQQNQISQNNN